MRKRTFIRPFEAATYNTPYQYLQRARIESAKKAIERNAQDVFSIMDEAGYQNEIPYEIPSKPFLEGGKASHLRLDS